MASTRKSVTSDGSTLVYTFDFDYLKPDFVKVYVEGVSVPFTLTTTKQITLAAAPASGKIITIQRETSTEPLVEFTDGSVLISNDLDTGDIQALHLAEEAQDVAQITRFGLDNEGALVANNRRITGMGEPTNDSDAVTKQWAETSMTSQVATAIQKAAEAAKSAADAALYDGPRFDTKVALKAAPPGLVEGSLISVLDGNFTYQVVASDGDVVTVEGEHLKVLPNNGVFPALAFDVAADAVTDDSSSLVKMNVVGYTVDLGGKTLRYSGTFLPLAKFTNGSINASNRTFDFRPQTNEDGGFVQQGLLKLRYGTVNSVRVYTPPSLGLYGFRMFGNWYNPRGRIVSSPLPNGGPFFLNSSGSGLWVESQPKEVRWYAVFAGVTDVGQQTAEFTQMPYFRVLSRSGSVVTLGTYAETTADNVLAESYNFTRSLVGADVLIISENGDFAGRTTKVTANTNSTITLADAGVLKKGDRFLVSPPGMVDYVYCGSHIIDNLLGESRNRAGGSLMVGTSSSSIQDLPKTGEIPSYTRFSLEGLVSPLATGCKITLTYTCSTASVGEILHQFSHDSSNHVVATRHDTKTLNTTQTFSGEVEFEFSGEQAVFINTLGSLGTTIIGRTTRVRRYVEP